MSDGRTNRNERKTKGAINHPPLLIILNESPFNLLSVDCLLVTVYSLACFLCTLCSFEYDLVLGFDLPRFRWYWSSGFTVLRWYCSYAVSDYAGSLAYGTKSESARSDDSTTL